MPFTVDAADVAARLPDLGTPIEVGKLEVLIADAIELIELEFWRHGRDFSHSVENDPMLAKAAKRVVYEMVVSFVTAIGRKGLRAVSSSTGGISDSWTFATGEQTGWASALLTDELKAQLGLYSGLPRGNFPDSGVLWPEVPSWRK